MIMIIGHLHCNRLPNCRKLSPKIYIDLQFISALNKILRHRQVAKSGKSSQSSFSDILGSN